MPGVIIETALHKFHRAVSHAFNARYDDLFHSLSAPDRRAAELIGVLPGKIAARRAGARSSRNSDEDRVLMKFFVALVLNDLIQEVSKST